MTAHHDPNEKPKESETEPPPETETEKGDEEDGGSKRSPWKTAGWRGKLRTVARKATVEPMLGCYIVASVLANLATQNLNLQKACRVNLRLGDEVCTALERRQTQNYSGEEIAVQQLVADMITWKTIVQSSVPAALIVFVGAWSDRTGRRKPGMLLPIVGELLTSVALVLCTYYFYELPMEVAGLAEAIFPALTGGWMTMFMAVFSYVGDITTVKTRTLRIGLVNVFCSVGIPIGTALSGLLYRELGSYGVYAISSALYVFSFGYGLLCVPESAAADRLRRKRDPDQPRRCFLVTFFDLQHVREAFAVAFKDDGHSRRLRIIMLMIVVIVVMGPLHGKSVSPSNHLSRLLPPPHLLSPQNYRIPKIDSPQFIRTCIVQCKPVPNQHTGIPHIFVPT